MNSFLIDSRQGFCNLFSEFLCEKISENGKFNTVIGVSDFESLIILKGITESPNVLTSQELVNQFISKYKSEFNFMNIENINTLDLISYFDKSKLKEKKIKIRFNKDFQYVNKSNYISYESSVNSKFPFGYSKYYLKNLYLYLEMIVYNIQNHFHYNFIEFEIEEHNNGTINIINIISDSIYPSSKLKSIIMDNFEMDVLEINEIIKSHDFMKYYLIDQNYRPWLKIKENSFFQVI